MCRWNCGHSEENPFCWTACEAASDLFELQTSDPCHTSDKTLHYKRNVDADDTICWTCTDDPENRITPESIAEVPSDEEADDELEEGEITETSEPEADNVAEAYLELEDSEMIESCQLSAGPKEWVSPAPKWPKMRARRNRSAKSAGGREPYYRVRKPDSRSGPRKNKRFQLKPLYRNKSWIGEPITVKAARRRERPNGGGHVVDEALYYRRK